MGRTNSLSGLTKLLIAVAILILLGAFGVRMALAEAVKPLDPQDTAVKVVTIPLGSGASSISQILEDSGIIKDSRAFRIVSKITGNDSKYKAGAYPLSPSMNAYQIMEKMKTGISVGNLVTIPEGYTVRQTARLLAEKGIVNEAEFMMEAETGTFAQSFVADLPSGPDRLEGFLFPETYDIPLDASSHDVIQIMLNHFEKVFTPEYSEMAATMGYSMREIIIIASMVERESVAAEDRPLVASVVYNRFAAGMPLQFDSTVQYVLGEQKDRLYYTDTGIDSPYNTYLNRGLPPGPICSPGADSIKATLYPADTDYLYFVVDPEGQGTHNFTNDYNEFLVYKQKYIDSL